MTPSVRTFRSDSFSYVGSHQVPFKRHAFMHSQAILFDDECNLGAHHLLDQIDSNQPRVSFKLQKRAKPSSATFDEPLLRRESRESRVAFSNL
jgi:hypothetical protein